MKKGLLSFLLAALTLVGCQNYDDQFDELNAKILALQSELTSISAIQSAINDLNTKIAAVNTKKSLNTTMSAAKPNVPTASAIKPNTPMGAIFITQLIIQTMASTIVFTPFKIGSRFFLGCLERARPKNKQNTRI